MRAHVAPPPPPLPHHSACTCAAAFLARACIMHGDPGEKYIFAVRRAEMYSPNYLRIGVPNFPPLLLLSPTTAHSKACLRSKERLFRPFSPLSLFQASSVPHGRQHICMECIHMKSTILPTISRAGCVSLCIARVLCSSSRYM